MYTPLAPCQIVTFKKNSPKSSSWVKLMLLSENQLPGYSQSCRKEIYRKKKILQGLGLVLGAATKFWPKKRHECERILLYYLDRPATRQTGWLYNVLCVSNPDLTPPQPQPRPNPTPTRVWPCLAPAFFCRLIDIIIEQILQGLRVAQAAVTERWP